MAESFTKLFYLQQSYQKISQPEKDFGMKFAIAKTMPKAQRTLVRKSVFTTENLSMNIPINSSVNPAVNSSVNLDENTNVCSAQPIQTPLNKIVGNNKVKTPAMPVAIVDDQSIEFSRIVPLSMINL